MKNNNLTKFLSISRLFKDIVPRESMVSLGNSFELPALFRNLGWRLISAAMKPGRVKVPRRMHQLSTFSVFVLTMVRNHGSTYTVKYLKACQLAVQKSIAGDRISSLREIDPDLPLRRLKSCGLPQIIPNRDVRAIRAGSVSVIRWWLTIFSVYRVISIPGVLKIKTITDGYSGKEGKLSLYKEFLTPVTMNLKANIDWSYEAIVKSRFGVRSVELQFLESASSTSKTSWTGFIIDAHLLKMAGLEQPLRVLMDYFRASNMIDMFNSCLSLKNIGIESLKNDSSREGELDLGRLAIKKEAAGKIRVFAMVDIWTQSILKPMHDQLFNLLKSLPNDGTFDQTESVRRANVKALAAKKSFGYDLSAATDRLPMELQVHIVAILFGKDFSIAWRRLLVERDYVLDTKEYKERVRYSVGQPMGALSSWAMLAITHHLIVQIAYRQAYKNFVFKGWFENYELLGDDIVIFDELVANQYLTIMEDIGVPINLSKSVVAQNASLEFAKVTMHEGQNVSAVSWKMFISQNTMMGRVNIAYSLLRKGIVSRHHLHWFKAVVSKSRTEVGEISLSLYSLLAMAMNSKILPLVHLISSVTSWRPLYRHLLSSIDMKRLEVLFKAVFVTKEKFVNDIPDDSNIKIMMKCYQELLSERIIDLQRFVLNVDTVEQLAKDMFGFVCVGGPMAEMKRPLLMCTKFSKQVRESENLSHWNNLYNHLERILRERLFDVFGKLQELNQSQIQNSDLSIENLNVRLEAVEEIDRFQDLVGIVKRARAKLDGKANVDMKESPILSLNLMVKALERAERKYETGASIPNRRDRRAII